nr:MAG TPA: Helix-turn-helix XRE-family like protein [Caudoviricetes sp.]
MKDINVRIAEVRTTLGLSMRAFGEKLGISSPSINAIEKGRNNPSDQTVKLICKEFNIDYLWLTEGKGEMFDTPDSSLDDLVAQYDLSEIDLYLIKAYLGMSKDERAEFSEAILNKLLTILKKELHTDQKN